MLVYKGKKIYSNPTINERIEVEKYTGNPTITLSKEMLFTPFLKVTLLSSEKILLS